MIKVILMFLLLIPAASAASSSSIACSWFRINCPANSTNSTTTINPNSTITVNTTITDLGKVSTIYSSGNQYTYLITLPKPTNSTGIFSFALLGLFGKQLTYLDSAGVNCTITTQVNCTATFLVSIGTYTSIEVERNGQWLYALKLPSQITTNITQPTILTQKTKSQVLPDLLIGLSVIVVMVVGGNIAYLKYMEKKHPYDKYGL